MPCLIDSVHPQYGALFQLGMGNPDTQKIEPYVALIDTGASSTCISQHIVQNLDLAAVGMTRMQAAGGVHHCAVYLVDFFLPMGHETYRLNAQQVTEFHAPDGFDVLLGRDILMMGHFTMSFNGTYTFCL